VLPHKETAIFAVSCFLRHTDGICSDMGQAGFG
jgi:hypothetical protein